MKEKHPVTGIILLFVLTLSCRFKEQPGIWDVQTWRGSDSIHWAKFRWEGDSMGNRFFPKNAMIITARIKGLPYAFDFQFDLGSNLTILYGNNIKSIQAKYPGINLKMPVMQFGDFTASTKNCYIWENYGDSLSIDGISENMPLQLGTIGADMFQNKILVIDYVNERFSICDSLPMGLNTKMTDISLDKFGRVILPMQAGGNNYKVMFDNGSSNFPLITPAKNIASFSNEKNTDTIQVSSWGTLHYVYGRPINGDVTIGGQPFSHLTVYADQRDEEEELSYDAITGNILFWDKTIIIDFKHRKFGVK